jgi:hypothetical protein
MNIVFFKLNNGEDCFGEVELSDENSIRFSPACDDEDEALKKHHYVRKYFKNDEYEHNQLEYILIPLPDIDLEYLYYWNEEFQCFINSQWNVNQQCWIHTETRPGSIPPPTYLPERLENHKCLKEVGYWQSNEPGGWDAYLPHPKYLVELGWKENERTSIVSYLRAGHECRHWCGYSSCRFGCFCTDKYRNMSRLKRSKYTTELQELAVGKRSMGCLDLTDGEWVWPEGLAHYVESHNICLPDKFILTMQKNSWSIPTKIDFQHCSQVGVSSAFWIDWSISYVTAKQR